jgi:enoyl-CoA hydratase/carnithine racemase
MSYISFKPRARGAMLMVAADLRIFFDKARAAFLFVKVGLSGADVGARRT